MKKIFKDVKTPSVRVLCTMTFRIMLIAFIAGVVFGSIDFGFTEMLKAMIG